MITIQTALVFIFALLAAPQPEAKQHSLLPDGTVLIQVPGTAAQKDSPDVWRFTSQQSLRSGQNALSAGSAIRILPCRGLELIMALAGSDKSVDIRLTGIVTQYEDINFLFVMDVLPIRRVTPEPEAPPPVPQMVTDPNETSVMPQEIFQQLEAKRKTDFSKMGQMPSLPDDRMIVSRTGYFKQEKDYLRFEINGFGLNAALGHFRMLPNQYRFEAERRLKNTFGRPRYTITAIETTFQGQKYLLLQQVQPAWSFRNFTP